MPTLVTKTSPVNLINLPETTAIYSLLGNSFSVAYTTNRADASNLYSTRSYRYSPVRLKLNDEVNYTALSTSFGTRQDESYASLSIAKNDTITDALPTTVDILSSKSLDIVFRSTPRTILLDNVINSKRTLSNRDLDFYNCRSTSDTVLNYNSHYTDVNRIKEYRLLRQSNNYIPHSVDIVSAEFYADSTIMKTNPATSLLIAPKINQNINNNEIQDDCLLESIKN